MQIPPPAAPSAAPAPVPAQIPAAHTTPISPADAAHAVLAAPPAPPAPPAPARPVPSTPLAQPAQAAPPVNPTPPVPPAHPVQAVSPASHQPAHAGQTAPVAHTAQTATPPVKTTVPPLSAPIASHLPGSAQSEPVATVPKAALAAPPTPAASVTADEEPPVASTPEEVQLTKEIDQLWTAHSQAQGALQKNREVTAKSRENAAKIRADLAGRLNKLKALLSRPGRGGRWSSFLTDQQIPRSTADSLVRAYKKTLNSEEKSCTTEQLPEQPEMAIRGYLLRQWPMLSQLLRSREYVKVYVSALEEKAEKSFAANGESPASPE